MELLENTGINKHAIKRKKDKQLLFEPIYSLKSVELETLKIYFKTNLVNGLIRLFKSFAKAFILFDKKSNISFRLYVNYWSLNNITIKNQYPLPLIGKLLDWLGQARRFTQLDFINA